MEVSQQSPSGQSLPLDVWTTSVGRGAEEWDVPLIPLSCFGIQHDRDGFREANELLPMLAGAEACPYYDKSARVVYKLFDLRTNGALGKKLSLVTDGEGGDYYVETSDAVLKDTLDKLELLNAVGGHPTEIMGLSDDGHYLIAKQPLALPYPEGTFLEARTNALDSIKCAMPPGCRLKANVGVIWFDDRAWLAGDFHERNIMIDYDNYPTVIDALVGAVPPRARIQTSWLRLASEEAEEWHRTSKKPIRRNFDNVPDSLL